MIYFIIVRQNTSALGALLQFPKSFSSAIKKSSPQHFKKKYFTNYRRSGFWLTNNLKKEGLINAETCDTLISVQQKTFEAKDPQEELYDKLFVAPPEVTEDLKEFAKSSNDVKHAEKEAAKAAKLVVKEAAKA